MWKNKLMKSLKRNGNRVVLRDGKGSKKHYRMFLIILFIANIVKNYFPMIILSFTIKEENPIKKTKQNMNRKIIKKI